MSNETYEERKHRLYQERKTKERLELEEVMGTIKLNKHTRMPILDSYVFTKPYTDSSGNPGKPFVYDRYFYRFETDEEMKERIAKDKLGKDSDRGRSWKERIVDEMKEHNDSWNQVIAIQVKCEECEKYEKEYESDGYKYPNPNKIKEQFDIEWYDVLWNEYKIERAEEWKFHIWTKTRVYFTYIGRGGDVYVTSGPRNPS